MFVKSVHSSKNYLRVLNLLFPSQTKEKHLQTCLMEQTASEEVFEPSKHGQKWSVWLNWDEMRADPFV